MYWAGLSTRHSLKAPISIYCNLKYLNINTRRINYALENKIACTFKRKHRFSEGVCSLGWMDSHGSAHTWSVFMFAFEQCDPAYFPVPPSGHRGGRAQGHLTTSLLRSNLPPCVFPSGVRSLPACPGQASLSFSLLCGHQEAWWFLSINGDNVGFRSLPWGLTWSNKCEVRGHASQLSGDLLTVSWLNRKSDETVSYTPPHKFTISIMIDSEISLSPY